MLENIELESYLDLVVKTVENYLFVWSNLIELVIFIALVFISYFSSKFLKKYVNTLLSKIKALTKRKKERIIKKLLFPLILLFLIAIYYAAAASFSLPLRVISIFGNLVSAWLFVKVISLFFPRTRMFRFLSGIVWLIAALRILNIYQATVDLLDSLAFSSGNLRLSLLLIIKTIIIFSVLFWLAGKISRILTSRIDKSEGLTPSVKVLVNKISKFVMFTLAILFTLSAVGIDLTAFAFIGSAIGVGLGFGLQKIVSNFISGIIILADKSIKPGDVIEIGSVYGWVRKLDTRFVSIVTKAGKEYLIPNEDFITEEVINWSYSDELVRVDAEVGVSYHSDLRQVQELMLEAVKDEKRVLKDPGPKALLMSFDDNEIVFELRFWINDPKKGIQNIRSQVLLLIWDSLKEAEIEMPFPQRDHHLKTLPDNLNKFLEQRQDSQTETDAKNNSKSQNKGG